MKAKDGGKSTTTSATHDKDGGGGGFLSHNSSPVQDEMSVNTAIRVSSKVPALRVAKTESLQGLTGSQKAPPTDKENNNGSSITVVHTTQSEQDTTVVVSGAMVLSDSAILKAVHQNN